MANVTVSGVDVTVTSEAFGGRDIPAWKLLGVFQEADASAWDVSYAEFISKDFTDWTSTDLTGTGKDFSSYLETGEQLLESPLSDKQPIYVNTFLSKTSKTQTVGGYYEVPTRSTGLYANISSVFDNTGTPRRRYEAVVSGDKAYLMGGTGHDFPFIYDFTDGSLTQGARYPGDYINGLNSIGGMELIGDQIYLFGGGTITTANTEEVWKYSIPDDSWSQMSSMPSVAHNFGHCTDGTDIYVVLPYILSSDLGDVWKYDVSANSWSTLSSSLPSMTNFQSTTQCYPIIVGTNMYVLEGAGGLAYGVFDLTTNTWSDGTNIKTEAVQAGGSVAHLGSLYLVGGAISGVETSKVYKYTPPSTFEEIGNLPATVARNAACVYEGNIYSFWGYPASPGADTDAVYKYRLI